MREAPNLTRRELAAAGLGLSTSVALLSTSAQAKSARRVKALSLDDRAGIQDLFTRYLWAYDCTDEEEFLALFADDALVVGRGKTYRPGCDPRLVPLPHRSA